MYRLDVRGLSFARKQTRLLHEVSLSFHSGELVALLGPSGSGKSTLLLAMLGYRRGIGRVELCGRDLYAEFDRLRGRLGFVPQDDVVLPSLSVERTLEYAAELRLPAGMPAARRTAAVRQVVEAVDLGERRRVKAKHLSGGQRKRLSLAVELLGEPPLLFMDEPTSGLDPALEEKMMALFRGLTGPDRLTVVCTHVTASLEAVDLAVFLARGRVVYVGPPAEARSFFAVDDFASIYRRLAKESPEAFLPQFRASSLYREFVVERLAAPPPPLPKARAEPG